MNFELVAGNLALDFANTVHSYGRQDPQDDLKGYADLVSWQLQAGLVNRTERSELLRVAQAEEPDASAVFNQFLRLREVVYDIFASLAQGRHAKPESVAALNSVLKKATRGLGIQRVGKKYKLSWEADYPPTDRALGEIARSAAELLTSAKLHRVRQCGGDRCSWLFLDTSRNGTRRWCDMKACGNRAKVRRFRQRHPA
jgi:predicted RNA-binding Zn ribbon-like protein